MASPGWTPTYPPGKLGVIVETCTLNAGDTSTDLVIPDFSDKTIHIFGGTFGNSSVSVKGLNSLSGTAQTLHRVNDPTLSFTSVSSETMALLLENPYILRASADGSTGTGLIVVISSKKNY